nr:putative ribonuclease H-like domain-containing protein [Tanacetum cinerariifolium]
TKHIEIRHHFIRDCFEKKLISVDHIHADENVADLLTKPFDAGRFHYLVCKLFPLLGKLSTVNVFLGFGLTFAGLACHGKHNTDFHPMVDFIKASPLRRTKIAQSSVPPTIADEPASPQRDVSQGEAFPTDSGFIADQDRATIDKSSTLPHDSALRVTSPAAVEGRDEYDEEEGATERVSDDIEEMATVLSSMDASTVLASRVVDVPTGSGSIPTASTLAEGSVPTGSEEVPTASLVITTATVVTSLLSVLSMHVITKDSISQCLWYITRFLILSFFEITQSVEELVFEIALDDVEQTIDDKVSDVGQPLDTDADETQADAASKIMKKDWFKKSPRSETLDLDWNTVKTMML